MFMFMALSASHFCAECPRFLRPILLTFSSDIPAWKFAIFPICQICCGCLFPAAKELSKAKEMAGVEEIPPVDFGVVVSGKQQFEVCRLFLASLQLVSVAVPRLFTVFCT